MLAVPHVPPRIRTDNSNPFAHHTMTVRVPAIIEQVREQNPDYSEGVSDALRRLGDELREGAVLPSLEPKAPWAEFWTEGIAQRHRDGEGWLNTDWFFAENYVYRQIAERVRYWQTGRDPFHVTKAEEYASPTFARAVDHALAMANSGSRTERAVGLLEASLFGNRIDLSFAASRERGTHREADDLLADDRERAATSLLNGRGPVHIVIDNAGTELTLDLVFADFVVQELGAEVVLHLKAHPAFVSDATAEDVQRFSANPGDGFRERLQGALKRGKLSLATHGFWNGPGSLWELPGEIEERMRGARLVVLKGDAHYRRALNDAIWNPATSFCDATAYFPAPLLALRMLKSDPIVGLTPGTAEALDRVDPTWRVNGRRGVASLGGSQSG